MKYLIDDEDESIKVSVYCLAYNHEKYIRKTLEGFVMQQTNFRYEVFVHDDASTDRTPDIIREYAERYPDIIKPIFQEENQYSKGVAISNKYIIPKMQGKYIASCEGDDYWCDSEKLQKQFDVMEAHPECSLSTHKVQCCNEDGTVNAIVIPEKSYHIIESGLIEEEELAECYWIRGHYPFHTSSYFYRRSVLDIELEYRRDIGILRKCLIAGPVYYINEIMSVRRRWSIGSWTSSMKSKGIQGRYDLVIRDNDAEDRFDQYTNYKYHDYIMIDRLKKFIQFAQYPEYNNTIKKLLTKYNLSPWKIRKRIPIYMFFKLQIKYTLVMHFPNYYSKIKKCWHLLAGYSKY